MFNKSINIQNYVKDIFIDSIIIIYEYKRLIYNSLYGLILLFKFLMENFIY